MHINSAQLDWKRGGSAGNGDYEWAVRRSTMSEANKKSVSFIVPPPLTLTKAYTRPTRIRHVATLNFSVVVVAWWWAVGIRYS